MIGIPIVCPITIVKEIKNRRVNAVKRFPAVISSVRFSRIRWREIFVKIVLFVFVCI